MKKRLPFLVMAGLGLLLWQAGFFFFPTERALTLRLPVPYGDVRRLEVQLYEGEALLKREELATPAGLAADPPFKLPLAPGAHRAVVLAWLAGSDSPRTFQRDFDPGRDEAVVIDLVKNP